MEVARRHVKCKPLTSPLKLVEEKVGVAAAKGAKAAEIAGDPSTAKAVVDKEGPPLRKKRRLELWPLGPENGEEPSKATRSWRSTWSDEGMAPINTKPTKTCREPPSQATQARRASQRGCGPGCIENIDELALFGEGIDESKSGYNTWTHVSILQWSEGAWESYRKGRPCRFNVQLDKWV